MKKTLILAAAAVLALAACSKNEITVNPNRVDEKLPIGFSNYTPRAITKADGSFIDNTSNAALANGYKFGVYSYATANGTAFSTSAIGTQFMDGVSVTFTTGGESDATKNTYSPVRYWPSGDTPDWLTFWAYYPVTETSGKATAGSNGITYTAPNGSNGLGSFAFTAAGAAADMVDFLVADVVNDKIYGTAAGVHIAENGVIPLTFHHMLTKVQFKFKTDLTDAELANTKVYLTDAKLIDIKTTGTLSATYATGSTTTTWTAVNTPADYEVFVNEKDVTEAAANRVDLTRTATTVANSEVFLMVPQTMIAQSGTNPQIIRVNWDVVTDGVTTHNQKDLYLDECVTTDGGSTQANIDWVKNHSVVYTITIGPKPIRFTATVDPWAAAENGYYSVN